MKQINVALSFLLEVATLAAFAYWGFHATANPWVRWLLAIGVPLAVIVVWGRYLAPKAAHRAGLTVGVAASSGLFGLAALALVAAGQPAAGVALLILAAVNRALVVAWRQW